MRQGFKTWQIVLFLSAGALALVAGYWIGGVREDGRIAAGATRLVDVSLPDSKGDMRTLGEWSDQAILLNFWATWCAPCRDEIPELVEAQSTFGDRGLQVIGVAIDKPEQVRAFMDDIGFNYPTLIAETKGMELMATYGNAGALPFTVAFDREGRLVGKKLGRVSRSEIRAFVDSMLGSS
ncbi:MAG: TlpA family protein disulfide reductase [Proteobacteria bacterium]|nr:MAG: TlpA family protein disulfide reductase [Pseudomonadota bacterium]